MRALISADAAVSPKQIPTATETSISGMLHAGKVIAATAVEVLQNPELIEKAKTELKERLQGKSYISPIPQDVKPLVKK
ncbi:hypothetical protein J7E52_00590 [Bacillus sp. ISL-34]|uniref:hypothetical protein n=1 Tax=Bacillus sp. ISL-34 TaxID=2819121 RepID=UPI001BEB862A|nr:hypothetical protein [Bacillus sp. ISL-34]